MQIPTNCLKCNKALTRKDFFHRPSLYDNDNLQTQNIPEHFSHFPNCPGIFLI